MRPSRWLIACCVVLAVGALSSCQPSQEMPAASPQAEEDPQFLADNAQWRQHRHDSLVGDDGWTTLVGLHWLSLDAHYVGSGARSGIRIAKGPDALGLVQQQRGQVYFTPERGVAVTRDGVALKGCGLLASDKTPSPTLIGFDEGRGELSLIERGDRKALRIRHADAEARRSFAGLAFWPADSRWRIPGRFVAHPPGKTIEIANIVGILEQSRNPGVLVFTRDGVDYRLEALDDGDGRLFVILADRTSGQGSYSAGRYLDVDAADAEGRVTLDFNRAYNPPCAFTDFATCPLPPPENRLDLAITAGEKTYAKPTKTSKE